MRFGCQQRAYQKRYGFGKIPLQGTADKRRTQVRGSREHDLEEWLTHRARQDVLQPSGYVPHRQQPDEEIIAAGVPEAAKCLEILDDALADAPYLAGDSVTLADLFVLPALNYLAMTPEGGPLLENKGNVTAWMDRMMARDSAQAILAA